jgi:ankyrin repeat protein
LPGAERPPQAPKPATQPSASYLGKLPSELQNELLQYASKGSGVLNIPALARAIKVTGNINSPVKLLSIFESLPTNAAAIYLAEELKDLPIIKNEQIQSWLTAAKTRLTNGLELINETSVENQEGVKQLLQDRNTNVNYNAGMISPLIIPIWRGHTQIIRLLLNAGANPNIRPGSPLANALNNKEIANLLIAAGADINFKDSDGQTDLMLAAAEGRIANLKALIAAGADVNIQNNKGRTPLINAAMRGQTESVQLLLAAGAKPNIKDNEGYTALIEPVFAGNVAIVKALLAAKANPNIPAEHDITALMAAAFGGHKELVNELLAAGADPKMQDVEGLTARDYALKKNHSDIAKLLEKAAGKSNQRPITIM